MKHSKISGRSAQIIQFQSILKAKKASFVAVYGRRRVGKTFLIREFFRDKGLYFQITGKKDGSLSDQLEIFRRDFQETFYPQLSLQAPANWHQAFETLHKELKVVPSRKKCILFFDELPWLSSKKSGFLEALDHFWNHEWQYMPNMVLIVCGSAASWMLEKLIHAKGGLHNRLTHIMPLKPFGLFETKKYLMDRGISLNHGQVLQNYMVTGGVPYYLDKIQKRFSAAQNTNALCFCEGGVLFDEFDKLFSSLFDNPDVYRGLVLEIAKHHYGISREKLLQRLKISTGGRAYKRLKALEEAGFIASFIPYQKKKMPYYRLIDEFCNFYAHWMFGLKKGYLAAADPKYWLKKIGTPSWHTWAGYTFESICHKHVSCIASALGIDSIGYEAGIWGVSPQKTGRKTTGAQIDLLFDRSDDVITLCEIKYTQKPFVLDRKIATALEIKRDIFIEKTKVKKDIQIALISAHGVKKNAWSQEVLSQVITLDDLFS